MTASKASEPFDIREAREQIAEQRELWLAERGQVIKLMAERDAATARAAEAGKMLAEQDEDYNRKTNALIKRHADQIVGFQAAKEAAELDAGRWKALYEMPRIRLLGYARDGLEGQDGDIQHIGFEFTRHEAAWSGAAAEKETGRATLLEFVDAALRRSAPER